MHVCFMNYDCSESFPTQKSADTINFDRPGKYDNTLIMTQTVQYVYNNGIQCVYKSVISNDLALAVTCI